MVGIKPKGKIEIVWSARFAYAIGLLASDGCLSKDGRHIQFTSKDREQIKNFMTCLGLRNKIGKKVSGYSKKVQPNVQFGDVLFYRFLLGIGLTPAKSKTIGKLKIPKKYFYDFLRGSFDGDGSFYSYYDPRWKSSFMFYTIFASASLIHLKWIRGVLFERITVKGHLTSDKNGNIYQLKYAKAESWKILKNMYYSNEVICLKRKRLKAGKALLIVDKVL